MASLVSINQLAGSWLLKAFLRCLAEFGGADAGACSKVFSEGNLKSPTCSVSIFRGHLYTCGLYPWLTLVRKRVKRRGLSSTSFNYKLLLFFYRILPLTAFYPTKNDLYLVVRLRLPQKKKKNVSTAFYQCLATEQKTWRFGLGFFCSPFWDSDPHRSNLGALGGLSMGPPPALSGHGGRVRGDGGD